MTSRRDDAAQLLHAMGYLHMRGGQDRKALAFLLLAHRLRPDDASLLRTLAACFVENEAGERALAAVDKLAEIENGASAGSTLLRARALWALGRTDEARRCFGTYVEMRGVGR
jgi:type III secretion protein Y